MEISTSSRSNALVLHLIGKFDIEQASAFESSFNEILAQKPANIGLDMNGVTYIDSSAIGSIIKSLNLIKNVGGNIVLFGLKPMILNVFKLARLDNFFTIITTEEFNAQYPE